MKEGDVSFSGGLRHPAMRSFGPSGLIKKWCDFIGTQSEYHDSVFGRPQGVAPTTR
jgi:hypothetical protein